MSDASDESAPELKQTVADSCRILAMTGLVREITGHVSARLPGTDEMVVRCRREMDPGVAGTLPADVKRVDLQGDGEVTGGYRLPGEFPIHSEIYRRRPDVGAVIHGHPRASLLCGIMGLSLRPIFGAYDPLAMILGLRGVPVYPRSVLIATTAHGVELADCIGDKDVCLLRGHGMVTVGRTVEEATVRAIKLETLAHVTLQVAQAGGTAADLPEDDIDEITAFVNNIGSTMPHVEWTYRQYLQALQNAAALPVSEHIGT